MLYELHKSDLKASSQVELPIIYDNVKIDAGYRIDMLVDERVVIELKVVESILPIHKAQLLSYLKLSGSRVGLLLNFHELHLRDGITRMVND